ncbi:MAG: hypothetical protein P8X55_04245, partial [Desulfosarcinaceae bacterium]
MVSKNNKGTPRGTRQGQRDRYWSLMLVGEHGRIIPVRHIKGVAILLVGLLLAALLALGILTFFYLRQSTQLKKMQTRLDDSRQQAALLRDEKDILLAKLVIENKIPVDTKADAPVVATEEKASETPAPQTPESRAPEAPAPKRAAAESTPATPAPAPKPEVDWKAEIHNFQVNYQQERSILKAVFKIYNVSKPKEPLAGRIVVIFKQFDDVPMKWLTVPRARINNGAPDGRSGQAFRINNYRTMEFKAFGLKPPIPYDTAVVFVFTAHGEMILKEEFRFEIKLPAPLPKTPEPTAPAEKKSEEQAPSQPENPPQ